MEMNAVQDRENKGGILVKTMQIWYNRVDNWEMFVKGINHSYYYEDDSAFKAEEL